MERSNVPSVDEFAYTRSRETDRVIPLNMKVVVNAYSARLGGGQTYLRNLLAHLPEKPELEVLVFAPDSLQLPTHPQVRRVHTNWPTTNPLMRALWERWVLPHFLNKQCADILFCPGGVVATRPPAGCKVVTMFRNMTPFDSRAMRAMPWGLQRFRNMLLHHVMLKSMSGADLTIFISEHARSVIEAMVHIPNPITIPHGIAEDFRVKGSLPSRPEQLSTGPYILYVSKFDIYKHQLEVVRGYAHLDSHLRGTFKLVLVGELDHPYAEVVRNEIRVLGLEQQVILYGPASHANLPALYQHAYANVFASSCENCPNILLEALAAGRPVLSSNIMPMPEFGGTDIEYFSPFDPLDIASAMRRVIADARHAQSVGAAARSRSNYYDWGLTSQRTWQALEALAAQKSAY